MNQVQPDSNTPSLYVNMGEGSLAPSLYISLSHSLFITSSSPRHTSSTHCHDPTITLSLSHSNALKIPSPLSHMLFLSPADRSSHCLEWGSLWHWRKVWPSHRSGNWKALRTEAGNIFSNHVSSKKGIQDSLRGMGVNRRALKELTRLVMRSGWWCRVWLWVTVFNSFSPNRRVTWTVYIYMYRYIYLII